MFLLSLMLSMQDANAINRGKIFPLEWVDASKFVDMPPCSLRRVPLDFAKTRTSLGTGFVRGDVDLRYTYVASAEIYSDPVITREVHDGLSRNATFGVSFPVSAHVVRLATDRLGDVERKRNIIVLLASEMPVDTIECEAFATQ